MTGRYSGTQEHRSPEACRQVSVLQVSPLHFPRGLDAQTSLSGLSHFPGDLRFSTIYLPLATGGHALGLPT